MTSERKPNPEAPAPEDDQAWHAFAAWCRTTDAAAFNGIGMRRITALWMAGWDAAQRARRPSRDPGAQGT